MNCKHLKIRSRKYVKYFYCSKLKKEIDRKECSSCIYKEYKKQNTLKNISKTRSKREKERFSIIYHDLTKCAVCGSKIGHIDLNEIFMGRNRMNSIKYGLIMPMCRECHTRFHNDRNMQLKYMRMAQKVFEEKCRKISENVGNPREYFISIFKRNYLD